MEQMAEHFSPEQVQELESIVQRQMKDWAGEQDMFLRERTIRVEESLKNQIELTRRGFEQVEKRFEQVDKRFELVDKQFEQVDKRFEHMDKRFDRMDRRFNVMFSLMAGLILTSIGGFITVLATAI